MCILVYGIELKPGDYLKKISALIIREISFKEFCDKHDDLCLEYDITDLWEAWEKKGPCFEVLKDGEIVAIWEKRVNNDN